MNQKSDSLIIAAIFVAFLALFGYAASRPPVSVEEWMVVPPVRVSP